MLDWFCMENIDRIREQIPITKNKMFMNHAAMSPLPKPRPLELQTSEDPKCRSGIVNLKTDKLEEVAEKLNNKGIVVSARVHGIRVSPHFYNTEEEIDKLMEEVKQIG